MQCSCTTNEPVNDEFAVLCVAVTYRTKPRRLLLVHAQVSNGVEALQMVARHRPTWHLHACLAQLYTHTQPLINYMTTVTVEEL